MNIHSQPMKTTTFRIATAVLLTTWATCFAQPIITSQPQSVTNLAGTTATFSVTVTGTPPFAFQWLLNSTIPLSGETDADLVLTNVSANGDGYSVIVTNIEGSVASDVAILTVLTPPRIITPPANQTASLFADATFRVTATGDPPLSYQWRFNDGDLIGMTNFSLTVTNVQRTNAGNYSVVVTNLYGPVTSREATLTIVPFNSIYCFGFSWTDTRGIGCNWPSPQYYRGRACNGPMWPEFLSTNIGLAYVAANNYAHCGATAANVLNQVINFPAPAKPQLSLYCLWAGDSDFLHGEPPDGGGLGYINVTNEVAWNKLIGTLIVNNSNAVDRLYAKGAKAIIYQTQTDDINSDLGTNSPIMSRYLARFNAGFLDAMTSYVRTKPDLRLVSVDMFSRINDVLAKPAQYGFTKTNISALDDRSLTNKSFTGPGADYVFWDALHATSKLHELMAAWHLEVLTNSVLEQLGVTIASGSPNIQMNRLQIGRDYTLQSSPDLSHWHDLQTFTAAAGTNQWAGATDGGTASFFRLKWQP